MLLRYHSILVICLSSAIDLVFATDNMETVLYQRILDGYDKHARPARNVSEPVHVNFQLELQQIIDVDEKNQLIQLNVWLHYEWSDFRLAWNPVDFGGLEDIRFPFGLLWKPDVLLFNSVDAEFDTSFPTNMVVYSNGLVVWIPPSITRSSCKIDIRYFPFDEQMCYMKYGSWTFGKSRLTLHKHNKGIDTTEYLSLHNDEWTLLATPVNLTDYEYNSESYQSLYVNFHLRRRTLYYAFNIITPSLLITGMSLVGFSLPVGAGEKIALEITVLASICVCFDIVAKVTPPTSESIPLLGIFFFCHMVIVTVSTVASAFILNLNYRTLKTHRMGDWTRKILLNWLPWLMMMDRPNRKLEPPPFVPKHAAARNRSKSPAAELDCNSNSTTDDWCHICQKTDGAHHGRGQRIFIISNRLDYDDDQCGGENDCRTMETRIEACLQQLNNRVPPTSSGSGDIVGKPKEAIYDILAMLLQLYEQLKRMTDKAPEMEEEDEAKKDWEFAGMVIDKLCLIMFTVLIACSTMIIIFSAPHVMA